MEAPAWFRKELAALDSDLRIRWSRQRELWMIERKVRRSLHPGTIKDDGWDDEVIRAREGYLLVGCVSPRGLSRHVLQRLKDSDLWEGGGWKVVADRLEQWERYIEEKSWENFSQNIRGDSGEIYEWLKIRDGRTVFSPGWVD